MGKVNEVRIYDNYGIINVESSLYPVVFLVSLEDFPELIRHFWRVKRINRNIYAYSGKIAMHRMIMKPRPDQWVKFNNGDTQDCRRENLRLFEPYRKRPEPEFVEDNYKVSDGTDELSIRMKKAKEQQRLREQEEEVT